ncbi:LysM peptidoglycan-binding domain-containing protein [Nocardioides pacificus]
MRLTRRGRAVVVGGAVSLMLAVGVVLGDGSVATEKAGAAPETRVVAVAPGDTLWGIASEIAAPGDTRDVVDEIQRLNALDSAAVMAGQRLRVPVLD